MNSENVREQLENMCKIKKEDFDKLFKDFFEIRKINLNDEFLKKFSKNIYSNYEIKKVEIKEGMEYWDFIKEIFEYFLYYYYDDFRNREFNNIWDYEWMVRWLNKYYPKKWLFEEEFNKLLQEKFPSYANKPLKEINKLRKKYREEILLYFNDININNIIEDEKYILVDQSKKFYKRNWKQIIWHLHWDIGEFLLYFL
jgi:hypothetical protein